MASLSGGVRLPQRLRIRRLRLAPEQVTLLVQLHDADQQLNEGVGVHVVDAKEMVPIWVQESDGGPTVLVVAQVHVGPLRFLHAHRHEEGVQEGDCLGVRERAFVHALTEPAPEGG